MVKDRQRPTSTLKTELDELRIWVARQMIAEDASWVADVVVSSSSTETGAIVALTLGHHFARICYEGAQTLRSPRVGIPVLADLLDQKYAATTARARHTVKVLDDTKKSEDGILRDLRAVHESVHTTLVAREPGWRRWLATDLGLYVIDGSLVAATTPTAYRLGLDPVDPNTMAGENLQAVVNEWGATTMVLTAATGHPYNPETKSLNFEGVKIIYRDQLTTRYLSRRFDQAFTLEEKLLLVMLEADLRTNLALLPLTEPGHEMPVFRARVITLLHGLHGLHALQRLLGRHTELESEGTRMLRLLLADTATSRLLGSGGRAVRNRCMHYELRDPRVEPDPTLQMAGLVEAVSRGASWDSFNSDVLEVSERAVEVLGEWRPARARRSGST